MDKCGAATRVKLPDGTPKPCDNAAGWGTDHVGVGNCRKHLGNTRNGKTAARKEIARRAVVAFALAADEEIPQLDPREVLAEELHRSRKVVKGLDIRINELTEIHGPTFHASGFVTGEAKPHVEWVMWQEARSHLKAVAVECHRAGIEVFYAELEERKVDIVERGFDSWCDAQGMTSAQKQEARRGFAQHLRLVA